MEWTVLDDFKETPTNRTEPHWLKDPLGSDFRGFGTDKPKWFLDSVSRAVNALEWLTAREIASGKCEGRIWEVWRIGKGDDGEEEYLSFWYDPFTANSEVDWKSSPVARNLIVPNCAEGIVQLSDVQIATAGWDFLNVDRSNMYLYEIFGDSGPLSIMRDSDLLLCHHPWAPVCLEDPRDELKDIDIVSDQEAF